MVHIDKLQSIQHNLFYLNSRVIKKIDHEMYHLPAYFVNPFYNVVVRLIVSHNLLEIKLVPYPV